MPRRGAQPAEPLGRQRADGVCKLGLRTSVHHQSPTGDEPGRTGLRESLDLLCCCRRGPDFEPTSRSLPTRASHQSSHLQTSPHDLPLHRHLPPRNLTLPNPCSALEHNDTRRGRRVAPLLLSPSRNPPLPLLQGPPSYRRFPLSILSSFCFLFPSYRTQTQDCIQDRTADHASFPSLGTRKLAYRRALGASLVIGVVRLAFAPSTTTTFSHLPSSSPHDASAAYPRRTLAQGQVQVAPAPAARDPVLDARPLALLGFLLHARPRPVLPLVPRRFQGASMSCSGQEARPEQVDRLPRGVQGCRCPAAVRGRRTSLRNLSPISFTSPFPLLCLI